MLSHLGHKTLAVDLDPQSNLTSMFLPQERLDEIYGEEELPITILEPIQTVVLAEAYKPIHIEEIADNLGLILGNLSLSSFEDKLSDAWLKCLDGDVYAFKLITIFHRIFKDAAARFEAEYLLIDVGPNLGAINRAVTLSSEFIVVPVASDLFSLQGLKNLGVTLKKWQENWKKRKEYDPKMDSLDIPNTKSKPIGYIVMQHSAIENKPVKAYVNWANRIPQAYSKNVTQANQELQSIKQDQNCIYLLKHFRSLAPMSMESNKPIFFLKPADGAIGAHMYAVQKCYEDFKALAEEIILRSL